VMTPNPYQAPECADQLAGLKPSAKPSLLVSCSTTLLVSYFPFLVIAIIDFAKLDVPLITICLLGPGLPISIELMPLDSDYGPPAIVATVAVLVVGAYLGRRTWRALLITTFVLLAWSTFCACGLWAGLLHPS